MSLFFPIVPEFSYVILITLFAVCFCVNHKVRKYSGFFFGVAWLLFNGANYNQALTGNNITPDTLNSRPILATGSIESLITNPNQSRNSVHNLASKNIVRFNFMISHIDQHALTYPIKVRLSWKNSSIQIKQNQQWQMLIKLKPAHGLANTGGFSYQTWLREHDLAATGYVKGANAKLLLNTISLRQQWFDRVNISMADEPFAKLYLALTFGVRDGLDKTDWKILQATGTQHLIAISGLHIGLIAGASYLLSLWLIRLLPVNAFQMKLVSRFLQIKAVNLNVHLFAVFLTLTAALFYSYLAGFSSPTLRALIMLALYWLMKVFGVNLSRTRLLLLTVVVILLLQPMSILGAGFWLSFYAVSIILFSHWYCKSYVAHFSGIRKYLISLFIIQVALTVFILPIAALLQNQLPLLSIVANLIAVPFISLVVLPITFLSLMTQLLFEAALITDIALMLLSWFWQWLNMIAQFEHLMIVLSDQQLVFVVISLFFLVIACLKTCKRKFIAMVALLPLLFLFTPSFLKSKNHQQHLWQVRILDVGQGLSVVIEKNGRAILYDTGASYPSGFIMAESVVLPYLKSQGIRSIDKMLISHSDNDHAGGANWLREQIQIDDIVANDRQFSPTHNCFQGQGFFWQGLQFKVLWPETKNSGRSNDESCVIQVSDGNHKLLLTGDISRKIEMKLLESFAVKSHVLVAPHHGSNTSSSNAFIQAVSPDYTVFSAGFMNRWNMPTPKVSKRYDAAGFYTLNTAASGMITFNFNQNSIKVNEYKKHDYPFWFAH